jgi:hypothetical protein
MSDFDPTTLFSELQEAATDLIGLMGILGLLIGVVMLGQAAARLIKGDPRTGEPNLTAVLVRSFIGSCLMQFATMVSSFREETGSLGSGVRTQMLDYASSSGSSLWSVAVTAVLMWVACIGGFAIMRGFLLLNQAGSGDSPAGGGSPGWGGFWHILAGAICMNIGLGS